jgi:hypothetical protein
MPQATFAVDQSNPVVDRASWYRAELDRLTQLAATDPDNPEHYLRETSAAYASANASQAESPSCR